MATRLLRPLEKADSAPPGRFAREEFERGLEAFRSRRPSDGLSYFSSAESRGYSADECASGRWHCRMLLGQFEEAWEESDAIAARGTDDPHRLWNGQPFDGKRLIIRCLHGLGDAIQFIRYARLLHKRTASITVETHAALVPLFSRLPHLDRVVTWEDGSSKTSTDWDQQIEVMEFPRAFRTTVATIPSQVPYLLAKSVKWGAQQQGPRRVGFLWASSEWNPARSLPIQKLDGVFQDLSVQLFSFQRGPRSADLKLLRRHDEVCVIEAHSPGILETADQLLKMDLVITVDTMAAHLAGALGKEVWMLLPFEADWRWMLSTNRTPWYPTMTLFRQSAPGDWSAPIAAVAGRLSAWSEIARL